MVPSLYITASDKLTHLHIGFRDSYAYIFLWLAISCVFSSWPNATFNTSFPLNLTIMFHEFTLTFIFLNLILVAKNTLQKCHYARRKKLRLRQDGKLTHTGKIGGPLKENEIYWMDISLALFCACAKLLCTCTWKAL